MKNNTTKKINLFYTIGLIVILGMMLVGCTKPETVTPENNTNTPATGNVVRMAVDYEFVGWKNGEYVKVDYTYNGSYDTIFITEFPKRMYIVTTMNKGEGFAANVTCDCDSINIMKAVTIYEMTSRTQFVAGKPIFQEITHFTVNDEYSDYNNY